MNELTMTVSGWVATDPKLIVGAQGARMTTFRLASTSRYFDRDKGEWVDGRTEWFTVRVFRAAAELVNNSIAKGQPVVVTGRFRSSTWESDSGPRTDLLLDASAVGHDLTRGIATFERASGSGELPREAYPSGVTPVVAGSAVDGSELDAAFEVEPEPVAERAAVLEGDEPLEAAQGADAEDAEEASLAMSGARV